MESQNPIIGSWELQYRVGYWTPHDTITPDSSMVDESLHFMVNDTVISEKHDRLLDTTILRKFTYEFGYKNWFPDSSYMLFIKDQAYHYYLSNDTLTLDDRYRDGSYELYLRDQSP